MKNLHCSPQTAHRKPLFCFLLSAFCFFSAQAQIQFPESGFEEGWTTKYGEYGSFLDFETDCFVTLNPLYALENGTIPIDLTAFRDPVKHSGQWSIRCKSGRVPMTPEDYFLPGLVGTLDPNFIEIFLKDPESGIPITADWLGNETPYIMEGWYRYIPVQNDSALISIGFYDEQSNEVFTVKEIVKGKVETWTKFSIQIPEQYWDTYFHEICVLFVASAGVNFDNLLLCDGQLGSQLWIDDLYLRYEVGIKQNLLSSLKANIFPNPATEVLNIELNEHFTGTISVYNISGRKVMEENIKGTQYQLNTSNLSSGNYIYKLMNENTIFAQGKFVVTK